MLTLILTSILGTIFLYFLVFYMIETIKKEDKNE